MMDCKYDRRLWLQVSEFLTVRTIVTRLELTCTKIRAVLDCEELWRRKLAAFVPYKPDLSPLFNHKTYITICKVTSTRSIDRYSSSLCLVSYSLKTPKIIVHYSNLPVSVRNEVCVLRTGDLFARVNGVFSIIDTRNFALISVCQPSTEIPGSLIAGNDSVYVVSSKFIAEFGLTSQQWTMRVLSNPMEICEMHFARHRVFLMHSSGYTTVHVRKRLSAYTPYLAVGLRETHVCSFLLNGAPVVFGTKHYAFLGRLKKVKTLKDEICIPTRSQKVQEDFAAVYFGRGYTFFRLDKETKAVTTVLCSASDVDYCFDSQYRTILPETLP